MHAAAATLVARSTRSVLRLGLALAVVTAGSGCRVDLAVPASALVRCTADSECPTQMRCAPEASLCVALDAEKVPPSVSTKTLNRSAVGPRTQLDVAFTTSEALLVPPQLALVASSSRLALTVTALGGNDYRAGYAPSGKEADGDYSLLVTLVDTAGNKTVDQVLSTVRLDATAPRISELTIAPRDLTSGSTLVVDVVADETLASAQVSLLSGAALTAGTAPAAGAHRFTLAADGTQADGSDGLLVQLEDLAGNVTASEKTDVLRFDYATPRLASSEVLTPEGRSGTVLAVAVSFTEPLSTAKPPVLLVSRQGGGTAVELPTSIDVVNGSHYLFVHTLLAGDPDGTYDVRLGAYEDLAGNTGPDVGALLGTVAVDNLPPVVTGLRLSGGVRSSVSQLDTYSDVAGFNVVTLGFDVDAALDTGAGGLAVTLGGEAFDCGAFQGSSPSYTCSHAVTRQADGLRTVQILARDAAGNERRQTIALVLDFTPPALLVGRPGKALYKLGELVHYGFELSEPVAPASVAVTALRAGAAVTGWLAAPTVELTRTGVSVAGAASLQAGDEGDYTLTVTATDDVGNRVTGAFDATALVHVDTTAPTMTLVSLGSNNPRSATLARLGDTVTAVFSVSETLGVDPDVRLGAAAMQHVDTSAGPPITYTFRRVITAGEDDDGGATLGVVAQDVAGNRSRQDLGGVKLDLVAPTVVPATVGVSLEPNSSNLIRTPTRVSWGTVARVSFAVSEALAVAPVLTPGTAGVWQITADDVATQPPMYVFKLQLVAPSPAPVTHTLAVTLTDLAGNTTTAASLTLPPPGLVADTGGPTPITTAQNDAILYSRTPWGSSATSGAPRFTVVGTAGAVTPLATVVLWSSADLKLASELGRAQADKDGAFTTTLVPLDLPVVYLSQVDEAGNLDQATPTGLRNVEWVATMGRKVAGRINENPHLYESRTYLTSTLLEPTALDVKERGGSEGMAEPDGALVVSGTPRWVDRSMRATPGFREQHAAAFDAARGRVVVFGGSYQSAAMADTWEWDGSTWTASTALGPLARSGHAMAYDAARGEVVLFGGQNGFGCAEGASTRCGYTWAYDGAEWKVVATTGPSARTGHAMAYDSRRHRVVLFGGNDGSTSCDGSGTSTCGRVWEWDGSTWALIATSGLVPAARSRPGLAYDPTRPGVVLFGGVVPSGTCDGGATTFCDRTWVWSGTGWTQLTTTGAIVGRSSLAMAFDVVRQKVLVFGGYNGASCAEGAPDLRNCAWIWQLTGTVWSTVTTTGVAGRMSPALVWDGVSQRPLAYGGFVYGTTQTCNEGDAAWPANCGATWELDGTVWRKAGAGPLPRSEAAAAYHEGQLYTMLHGGSASGDCGEGAGAACGYTWAWDGIGWTRLATTGPGARHGGAMAYFYANGTTHTVALFGGLNDVAGDCGETTGSYCGATWVWYGGPWYNVSPASSPAPRVGAAMATFDATPAPYPKGTVMFGGYNDLPSCGEVQVSPGLYDYRCGYTWKLDYVAGYHWTQVATTGLTQRFAAGAAFTAQTSYRVVLYGGDYQGASLGDTAAWNGSAWTTLTAPGPDARDHVSLVFDRGRGSTLMFGGSKSNLNCESYGTSECPKLWELIGSTWAERTPAFSPARRSGTTMAYDTKRKRTVLFGGISSIGCGEGTAGYCGATWELDGGAESAPGQVMSARFAATGETLDSVSIQSVTSNWSAGARSRTTAACSTDAPGARLMVWDQGDWRYTAGVNENAATEAAPAALTWSTATDPELSALTPAQLQDRVRRLFFGRNDMSLVFAVRPLAGNGCTTSMAPLSVDYAEVRVRYQRR